MKNLNKFIALATLFPLFSCTNDAPEVKLTVIADKTEVAVGEPVTLSITHNVQGLCVFAGDEGHNYYNSAAWLLNGLSEEELKSNIYRESDPDVKPMLYDFSDAIPGASVVGTGMVDVVDANSGNSLIGSEAEIVADPSTGNSSLCIVSTHPDWWYQALRINLDSKLGSNQRLTLTMHFDKDILEDIYTGQQHPEMADFCVVVRAAGKARGQEEVVFNDNTVWDIYWRPSITPTEYTVDLSRVIAEWQGGTGLEMETISYVQILFTATGSVGYVGNIYVDKIEYGEYDYTPFDTAESIVLGSGPGTVTYTHAFEKPGQYEMVVMGTNTSWKNYTSDGYNNSVADKVSANEYNYDRQIRTVKIKVTE